MKPLLEPEEHLVFDMYFATIVGMNQHPGNTREPVQRKSINDCAMLAVEMIGIRRSILGGKVNE